MRLFPSTWLGVCSGVFTVIFLEWFVLLNFDVIYSRCQSFVKYVFENYIYLHRIVLFLLNVLILSVPKV